MLIALYTNLISIGYKREDHFFQLELLEVTNGIHTCKTFYVTMKQDVKLC